MPDGRGGEDRTYFEVEQCFLKAGHLGGRLCCRSQELQHQKREKRYGRCKGGKVIVISVCGRSRGCGRAAQSAIIRQISPKALLGISGFYPQ